MPNATSTQAFFPICYVIAKLTKRPDLFLSSAKLQMFHERWKAIMDDLHVRDINCAIANGHICPILQ